MGVSRARRSGATALWLWWPRDKRVENRWKAHKDISLWDHPDEEASKHDPAHLKLDGDIGRMVNHAGRAMATTNTTKLDGMFAANLLDVGGGAGKETVTAALKTILQNPNVTSIRVKIFGGIMRCDTIADGIVAEDKVAPSPSVVGSTLVKGLKGVEVRPRISR